MTSLDTADTVGRFPFAGLVDGRPYPPTELGRGGWRVISLELVAFADLILTQERVVIPALWGITSRAHINDAYPHVVAWSGQLYLEDGHNRVTRHALAEGATCMLMRVYRPGSAP